MRGPAVRAQQPLSECGLPQALALYGVHGVAGGQRSKGSMCLVASQVGPHLPTHTSLLTFAWLGLVGKGASMTPSPPGSGHFLPGMKKVLPPGLLVPEVPASSCPWYC